MSFCAWVTLAGCTAETSDVAAEGSLASASEAVTTDWQALTLNTGWTAAVRATPSVRIVNGVVRFKGALIGHAGAGISPFTLPETFRASGGLGWDSVRLRVSMSGNTGGSLAFVLDNVQNLYKTELRQDGYDGPGPQALTLTSLEGVSFDKTAADATQLTNGYSYNGWTNEYSFRAQESESAASVKLVDGFVRFQGQLVTGQTKAPSQMLLFTIPSNFRPGQIVNLPTSLCADAGTTYGRVQVRPNGEVWAQPVNNDYAAANCGTALEGLSFSLSNTPTSLPLATGWSAYSPRAVKVRILDNVVRLEGAVKGSSSATITVGTLPTGMRPITTIYVVADANGTRARLAILYNGDIQLDSAVLPAAKSQLSLDGVSFAL